MDAKVKAASAAALAFVGFVVAMLALFDITISAELRVAIEAIAASIGAALGGYLMPRKSSDSSAEPGLS